MQSIASLDRFSRCRVYSADLPCMSLGELSIALSLAAGILRGEGIRHRGGGCIVLIHELIV